MESEPSCDVASSYSVRDGPYASQADLMGILTGTPRSWSVLEDFYRVDQTERTSQWSSTVTRLWLQTAGRYTEPEMMAQTDTEAFRKAVGPSPAIARLARIFSLEGHIFRLILQSDLLSAYLVHPPLAKINETGEPPLFALAALVRAVILYIAALGEADALRMFRDAAQLQDFVHQTLIANYSWATASHGHSDFDQELGALVKTRLTQLPESSRVPLLRFPIYPRVTLVLTEDTSCVPNMVIAAPFTTVQLQPAHDWQNNPLLVLHPVGRRVGHQYVRHPTQQFENMQLRSTVAQMNENLIQARADNATVRTTVTGLQEKIKELHQGSGYKTQLYREAVMENTELQKQVTELSEKLKEAQTQAQGPQPMTGVTQSLPGPSSAHPSQTQESPMQKPWWQNGRFVPHLPQNIYDSFTPEQHETFRQERKAFRAEEQRQKGKGTKRPYTAAASYPPMPNTEPEPAWIPNPRYQQLPPPPPPDHGVSPSQLSAFGHHVHHVLTNAVTEVDYDQCQQQNPVLPTVTEPISAPYSPHLQASSALDPLAQKLPDSSLTMLFSVLAERQGKRQRKGASTTMRCLLDSGSSHSFVSARYKSFVSFAETPSQGVVHMANGAEQNVKMGQITLNLGGCSFIQTVGVMPMGQTFDVVLGDDWLNKFKAHLNYDRNDPQFTGKDNRHVAFVDPISHQAYAVPVPHHLKQSMLNSVVHNTAADFIQNKQQNTYTDISHMFLVQLNNVDSTQDYLRPPMCSAAISTDQPHTVDDSEPQGIQIETESLRTDIEQLLHEFQDRFPADIPAGLPPDREGVAHAIPLKSTEQDPPSSKYYRLTPAEKVEVEKQLTSLLEKEWIQPSHSPYASPILFVAKKDGGLRMCVDYRKLNDRTVKNKYPLPRIDELLDCLHGAQYFTALDLQQAYHQVRLQPEDVHKTAFVTHKGQFEYRVLCFGLSNAPATFQALMNRVLGTYLGTCCLVYMDDILVFSKTPQEHLQHLRCVLQCFRQHQLYCKLSKCKFALQSIPFLGQVVTPDGIKPNPAKVQILVDWPEPTNAHELRCFLGLAQYLAKFIPGYAVKTVCLQALLRKNVPWNWTDTCSTAFQTVKADIITEPVLALPDHSQPFEVVTDACSTGIGAVLLQNDRPIAFAGRQLLPAETRYSTTDQELLAVIFAVKQWRCYLHGAVHPFVLVTDHHPNTYLNSKPLLSNRQARWSQKLQDFNFEWQYRPGKSNIADPISRSPALLQTVQTSCSGMHFDWCVKSDDLHPGSCRRFCVSCKLHHRS